MIIRLATKADASQCANIFAGVISSLDYYNVDAKRIEVGKYTAENLSEMSGEADRIFFVAIDSSNPEAERVIGFCIGVEDDMTALLNWFVVSPEWRNRGVAKALVQKFKEEAVARELFKIWCDSRTTNIQSISLLCREGFEVMARLQRHWFNQDFYIWEWRP